MTTPRDVCVHLVPQLVEPARLQDGIAVVIDALRASTTIVHALAAGCLSVRPCVEIAEAQALATTFPAGSVLLGGERGGRPIPGFDLGNSPAEYSAARCYGKTLILTTSHGTRAIPIAIGPAVRRPYMKRTENTIQRRWRCRCGVIDSTPRRSTANRANRRSPRHRPSKYQV